MKNIFETTKGNLCYEFINKESDKNLLLIHGFMEDHEIWDEIINEVDANIILVDLLGYGNSIPNDSFDFSMQQHAISINELLESLLLQNLYVLGHSMGGYITLELSLLNPDINIGLLHSTCIEDNDERKANRDKTIKVLELDEGKNIFIREFYWNLFAEHRKNEFADKIEILKQQAKTWAEKIPVQYIIETVKGLRDRKDHTKTWELSAGNNLLIGGTHDKLLDVEELEELAFLGDADWVEMTNSGHMGFYEEPEGLIIAIRLWMGME